jgi:hypothetical protein
MQKSIRFLFLLFFLWKAFPVFAQQKLIARIDTSAVLLALDNLDNTYLVTPQNELLKYDASGKLKWNYSIKNLGKLSQVDVRDPMRIVLFYPAFQQVVVLNNNLNEISRYSFIKDNSKQITLVTSANTNGYWVFDQNNRELLKLSNDFTDELKSGNIYQQTGKDLQPDLIQSDDQYVYLHDPKEGILQFDRFGAYSKTILTDSLHYFQVNENSIFYLLGNSIKKLQIQTYNEVLYPLPLQVPVKQAIKGNKIISILTEKAVFLYDL